MLKEIWRVEKEKARLHKAEIKKLMIEWDLWRFERKKKLLEDLEKKKAKKEENMDKSFKKTWELLVQNANIIVDDINSNILNLQKKQSIQ